MGTIASQKKNIDFSVIIPAKNEAANIGRCLDSIANVDWQQDQYEVIIVDNGSSDATVAIAREKGAQVFIQPELTISGLRNFGAAQSSGEVLAFLDADCAVDSKWLSSASTYLNDADGVSAFGSPVVVPDGGTWVQNAWFHVRGKPNLVVDVNWLESANLFVKRKAFVAVSGFNESLVTCEDYDLTQRLKEIGRLVSDFRVRAIHYREPATVLEFIKKEMWRSKSNYSGLLKRKIDMAEIPSLVLPVIYGLLLSSVVFATIYSLVAKTDFLWLVLTLLLIWQAPMLLMTIKKAKKAGWTAMIQLYFLFNAYFFARSLAIIRRG